MSVGGKPSRHVLRERQAMEDPKWLWLVATFPHVSVHLQAQVHLVIQAQRKDNTNICLRLILEAGFQATSGYPVWVIVDWTSSGRPSALPATGSPPSLQTNSPIQLNQFKAKATSVSSKTEQKPFVFGTALWVSICIQKRDQNGDLRKVFPQSSDNPTVPRRVP